MSISRILELNGNDEADLHFRLAAEGFGMVLDNPYDPNARFRQIEINNAAIHKVTAQLELKYGRTKN